MRMANGIIHKELESTARELSKRHHEYPWYIFRRKGSNDVIVPECEVKRYMKLGYEVLCAYHNGKRYKNVYLLGDGLHFVY